jgi:hypothetical protein
MSETVNELVVAKEDTRTRLARACVELHREFVSFINTVSDTDQKARLEELDTVLEYVAQRPEMRQNEVVYLLRWRVSLLRSPANGKALLP